MVGINTGAHGHNFRKIRDIIAHKHSWDAKKRDVFTIACNASNAGCMQAKQLCQMRWCE